MYITTREMVISIICNACGVLGLILWAIEAHKANAIQYIQRLESVESVGNNDDIIVRSNLEPFRVDEPKDEPKTQIKTQNSNLTFEKTDEPQTDRKCIDCKFLTYRFNKTWCDIKCDNPHDKVCDRWTERGE